MYPMKRIVSLAAIATALLVSPALAQDAKAPQAEAETVRLTI
jgi:hypothetical protein